MRRRIIRFIDEKEENNQIKEEIEAGWDKSNIYFTIKIIPLKTHTIFIIVNKYLFICLLF